MVETTQKTLPQLLGKTLKEIRDAQKFIQKNNHKFPDHLVELPKDKWRMGVDILIPPNLIAVWRSKKYLVQVYGNQIGGCVRLSISRALVNDKGEWYDGLTWDEIQQLKSECGFGAMDAIEVYPADKDVVNVANMRHIWILPGLLEIAWRNQE